MVAITKKRIKRTVIMEDVEPNYTAKFYECKEEEMPTFMFLSEIGKLADEPIEVLYFYSNLKE